MLKERYAMNDIPKIFIMIAISIKYRNPVKKNRFARYKGLKRYETSC
jgi:hypothetical protein